MKRTTLLCGLLAAFFVLLCFPSALADGPVNPYQSLVWKLDRRASQQVPSLRYYVTGITITQEREPTFTQTGLWRISIDNSLLEAHGAVTEAYITFQSIDPTGNYSTEYLVREPSDLVESCLFVAPGRYRLAAYYDFEDKAGYVGFYTFTIAEDGEHPSVDQKVTQILNDCRVEGNPWQTVLNLHDWLTHNAYYDYSYSFYGAEDVLLRGYGVCDSYSKAFQFLLNKAGIPNQRVTSVGHAWNAVQTDGKWYHIDATWDDPGHVTAPISGNEIYEYFCINDELIYGYLDGGAHAEEADFVNQCSSLDASYAIHEELWRDYGSYRESGSVKGYPELFLSSAQGSSLTYTVPGNADFPSGTNGYYSGTGRTARLSRYYYAYGLSREGLETADGNILDVSVAYNPLANEPEFTISVLGWRLPETGTLTIPEEVTTIAESAFENADATAAEIPEGCLTICDGAFRDSHVHRVTIPGADTELEGDPFSGCSPLLIVAPAGSDAAEYANSHEILWMTPASGTVQ